MLFFVSNFVEVKFEFRRHNALNTNYNKILFSRLILEIVIVIAVGMFWNVVCDIT